MPKRSAGMWAGGWGARYAVGDPVDGVELSMPDINADLKNAPRCLHCGYVLIGLPEDRCPECGRVIDWAAIQAAGRPGELPLDTARGWRLLTAGLLTWVWVLVRPIRFARRLSEKSRLGRATVFALVCMAVGMGGNAAASLRHFGDWHQYVAWVAGCWVHIEVQSLLFFLCNFRWRHGWRLWSFWRKVSLYTTAFVVLDWAAGPPILMDYTEAFEFPWILDEASIRQYVYWPIDEYNLPELVCGAVYYWWMIVLTVVLCVWLRRKWTVPVILVAMPGVLMISWRLGYSTALFVDVVWQSIAP
ncbi:MAG: hypothetical protein PVJ57_08620 [Phycisphaerae bacterium]